jgi:hypothetical protein
MKLRIWRGLNFSKYCFRAIFTNNDHEVSNCTAALETRPLLANSFVTQEWSNWKVVFSTQSLRWLRAATVELLGVVFSMWPVPRLYNEESPETTGRMVGRWCEMAASLGRS